MAERGARNYVRDERGASAAEFAIVLLPFIALVLGILWLSLTIYGNSTLQNAAEAAARCGVVRYWSPECSDATAIKAYALSIYYGPGVSPNFNPIKDKGCGSGSWTVTATATIPITTGLVNTSIPLSASACFP